MTDVASANRGKLAGSCDERLWLSGDVGNRVRHALYELVQVRRDTMAAKRPTEAAAQKVWRSNADNRRQVRLVTVARRDIMPPVNRSIGQPSVLVQAETSLMESINSPIAHFRDRKPAASALSILRTNARLRHHPRHVRKVLRCLAPVVHTVVSNHAYPA